MIVKLRSGGAQLEAPAKKRPLGGVWGGDCSPCGGGGVVWRVGTTVAAPAQSSALAPGPTCPLGGMSSVGTPGPTRSPRVRLAHSSMGDGRE